MQWLSRIVLVASLCSADAATADESRSTKAEEFFEKRIRPILAENCFNCHSAQTNSRGGLRVDDRAGLITGGQSGPAVIPGKPEDSLLIVAVSHTSENLKMPPKHQLNPEQLADLRTWIAHGATWPAVKLAEGFGVLDESMQKLKREHWAWQPLKRVAAPDVRQKSWPSSDVDQFVLAKWEEKGWTPQPDASADNLVRRLHFDLTGLPPSTEESEFFRANPSPQSFIERVDHLLNSPAFGEKWGRHWLDVARYAESTGPSRNIPYPHAWRYRDYVITAINNDKPYDQFIREQIAGDLLPAETSAQRDEHIIATGFLAIGMKDVNQRFRVRFLMDNVDEQIDAVSRTFLALTVSCARCHDHKFDPITSREYYGLAGIFTSTDLCAGVRNKMGGSGLDYYAPESLIVLSSSSHKPDPSKVEELRKKVELARAEFQSLDGKREGNDLNQEGVPKRAAARQKWNKLQQDLVAFTDPATNGTAVMGVRDAARPGDTEIRVRGEAEKLGPNAPRGFLEIIKTPSPTSIDPKHSGRLELADWLTSPSNPLTARVVVNRVWMHLFGEGLVRTVDNFGVTGDRPTHPELLDYLADEFVRDGWSIKRLIRRLVLTRLYRLDSRSSEVQMAADPDNRFLWRHTPRRLTAEELRDTILFSSGSLDLCRAEKSAAANLHIVEINNNGPEARRIAQIAFESRQRSIYLPLLRDLVPLSLTVFDFADQSFVVGRRDDTNVPAQSLFFLNSKFVLRESLALAKKLLKKESDDTSRIKAAYRLILGREASAAEIAAGNTYLGDYALLAQTLPATKSPVSAASVAQTLSPDNQTPKASPSSKANGSANSTSDSASTKASTGKKKAKVPVIDPDEAELSEIIFEEPFIPPTEANTLAWMTFCQSLFASAEFRYLR